ncbi:uncharacterized protein LOC118457674 [Anopheles albimanus]|nr:uncharacterized protein LOC118457674 [Anopheles albimanus]
MLTMWCPVVKILPSSSQQQQLQQWNRHTVRCLLLVIVFCHLLATGLANPIPATTVESISANELDATDLEPVSGTATPELTTTTTPATTTTARIPVFNRRRVSLEIASDLFSSSTSLALGMSNMLGDMVRRTSVRIAQLVRLFQPLFGYHLMIDVPKELDT